MKSLMISLALAVALSASSAWACSCVIGGSLFPRDGSTNVPTNVVIRAVYNAEPTASRASLRRATDQREVTLAYSTGPTGHLFNFTPTTKLDPNTRYTLSLDGEVVSFTTGAGEDNDAPSKPTLGTSTYDFGAATSNCGESKTWNLDITGGDDATSPREDLMVLVHDTGPIGATTLVGAQLRTGLCSRNFAQPGGSPMTLSVQVMDLAGNVSELSSTQSVRACSVGSGGALMALALLLARRRRG